MKVTAERVIIIGTKYPAILSAMRWMGACKGGEMKIGHTTPVFQQLGEEQIDTNV